MKLFATFLAVTVAAIVAGAQHSSPPLRTLHGTVVDHNGKPVSGSVVYLHDETTNTVVTRITNQSGHYRFSGINFRRDYRIHAEHQDSASRIRRISAHDTSRTITLDLKLNGKKAAHSVPDQGDKVPSAEAHRDPCMPQTREANFTLVPRLYASLHEHCSNEERRLPRDS